MPKEESKLTFSALIVDDEKESIETLLDLIRESHPSLRIIDLVESVDQAMEVLDREEVDLVFLDIEMPGRNGFELLKYYDKHSFQVVFVSGFIDYAIQALRANALDFLVKPIDPDELTEVLLRVDEVVKVLSNSSNNEVRYRQSVECFFDQSSEQKVPEYLTLLNSDGFELVKISDIIYLRGERNYTQFFLRDNKKVLVSKTLKGYEELLRDFRFFRTHKSCVVNLSEIKNYQVKDGGSLIMSNGDEVEVSRRRYSYLLSEVKAISLG